MQQKRANPVVATIYANRSFDFYGDGGSKKLTKNHLLCQKHLVMVRKLRFGKPECLVCKKEPFKNVESLMHAIGSKRIDFETRGMKLAEKMVETDLQNDFAKLRVFYARMELGTTECYYARWQITSRDRYELVLTPEKALYWENGVRTNPSLLSQAIASLAEQYPKVKGAIGFEIPITEFNKIRKTRPSDLDEKYHFVSHDGGDTFSIDRA